MSSQLPKDQAAPAQKDQKINTNPQAQPANQNSTQVDNSKNKSTTASNQANLDNTKNQSKPAEDSKKNTNDQAAGDLQDNLVQSQLVPNSQEDYNKKLETLKNAQADIAKSRFFNDKKRKELKMLAELLEQEIQKTLKKKSNQKPFDPEDYKSEKLEKLKQDLNKQILDNKKLKDDIISMQQLEQFNDAIHKIAGLKNRLKEKENHQQELEKTKEFLEALKKKHELLIEGLSTEYKYKERKESLNKEITEFKKKLKELLIKDQENEKIYIQKNEQLQQLKDYYRNNAQKMGFVGNPLEGYDLFQMDPSKLNDLSELDKAKMEKKKRKQEKEKKLQNMYNNAKEEEEQKKSGQIAGNEQLDKSKAPGKNAAATTAPNKGDDKGPRKIFYASHQSEVDKTKLKRNEISQEELYVKEQRQSKRQLEEEAQDLYSKLIDEKLECNPANFDKVIKILREQIAIKDKNEKEYAREIDKLEHEYQDALFERNQIQDKLDKREVEAKIVTSKVNELKRIIQHKSEPNVMIAASQILKQGPQVDKKIFIRNQLLRTKRRGVSREVQGYMFSDTTYHIFDDSELMEKNLESKIFKIAIFLYQGIIIGIKTSYQLKELVVPPKQIDDKKQGQDVPADKQQAGDSQNKQQQPKEGKDQKKDTKDQNKDNNDDGDENDNPEQSKPKDEYKIKEIVAFPKFLDESSLQALEGQEGFEKQELTIEETDFLKSISGIFTHKIEFLKFETNEGKVMKGGRLGFHQQSEEFRIDVKRTYTPIALFGAFIHKPPKKVDKKKDLNTSQVKVTPQEQSKAQTGKPAAGQPQQQNTQATTQATKSGDAKPAQPQQQQPQKTQQPQQQQQASTKLNDSMVTDVDNQEKGQDIKLFNIKEVCLIAIGIEIKLPFDPLRLPYFEDLKKKQKDEIEEEILSIDEDDDEFKETRLKRLEMQRKIRYKLKKSPRNSLSAKKVHGSPIGGYKNQYTEKLAKIAGLSLYNSQKEEEFYKQKINLDKSKDLGKDNSKNQPQKDKGDNKQQAGNKDKKPDDKNAKDLPQQQTKKK